MPEVMITSHTPVRLSYREAGPQDGPVLVLIPPLIWGASVYDPIVDALSDQFRLIICDLHGHGGSGYRSDLRLEEMAADFYRLLSELGLNRVTLVGYSIGGMIALRLALSHPELIDKLVLIAASADSGDNEVGRQTQQLWQLFRAGERESIADPALSFFFSRASFARRPDLIAEARAMLLAVSEQEAAGMFEAAGADFAREDICERLAALEMPTLVIAGAEDLTASPQEAERMAGQLADARVLVIPETNHLLALEQPTVLANAIQDFAAGQLLATEA